MKRKNYIVFVRHLKSIKDLVDFYEYIAGSKVCGIAIYLLLIICSPFIALLFPIAYIEHCFYKKDLLDNVLNTTGVQRNILKRLLISEKMILRRWSDDYQELQI